MHQVELTIDVTEAAGLGIPAHTAVTVYLPEGELCNPPVVCFGFPGGGYNRRYYSFAMPGSESGGEAGYHVQRGWIFVACDHLGVGDSTIPEGNALTYENVARANLASVEAVMAKLGSGQLLAGFAPVHNAVKLGIGQSMGGCFTIVLQGQHAPFDGIASLGYSAIHTVVPSRPGAPPAQWPWIPRGSNLDAPMIVNQAAMAATQKTVMGKEDLLGDEGAEHPFRWSFHYDDVPDDIVAIDLNAKNPDGSVPLWRSTTTPSCAIQMVAPGTVAPEAATISVPVLVAVGERDVVPDPWQEPKAFKSAIDVTVFVCPRMGHMHNFASTREAFWQRLHHWGTGVAEMQGKL